MKLCGYAVVQLCSCVEAPHLPGKFHGDPTGSKILTVSSGCQGSHLNTQLA
jgi:hypothetical protein